MLAEQGRERERKGERESFLKDTLQNVINKLWEEMDGLQNVLNKFWKEIDSLQNILNEFWEEMDSLQNVLNVLKDKKIIYKTL